jgi:hypothetical protein
MASLFSSQVHSYALEHGLTDLQAYRAIKMREEIKRTLRPFDKDMLVMTPKRVTATIQ